MSAGYQPLVWIQFGGPNGIYLPSITRICVTRLGSLCCIEFEYDSGDMSRDVCKLGRRKTTDFSHVTRFEIDGRAGEYIQSIEVNVKRTSGEKVYKFCKHGMLRSSRVRKPRRNLSPLVY